MSNYIFSLNNYQTIKKANIVINGITVLTGINGSGKSTISKWLYYIVNGAHLFNNIVYADFALRLFKSIQIFDLMLSIKMIKLPVQIKNIIHNIFTEEEKKLADLCYSDSDYNELVDMYDKVFQKVSETIKTNNNYKELTNVQRQVAKEYINEYLLNKEERKRSKFFELLQKFYHISPGPDSIQLEENNVDLFSKEKVGYLNHTTKAIYIDTPIVFSPKNINNNRIIADLYKKVFRPCSAYSPSLQAKEISKRIRILLNGDVISKKNNSGEDELYFVREDGLEVSLEEVSTGMKSLIYIQRLLKNGYLDDNTLLIFDNPETHLHPQYIIEFARLLVMLHHELGVKILISSHNPDMVAALQAIASKENVMENLHFYLSKPTSAKDTYEFVDQGQNIEEIFKSFNVAYKKIEEYGNSDF